MTFRSKRFRRGFRGKRHRNRVTWLTSQSQQGWGNDGLEFTPDGDWADPPSAKILLDTQDNDFVPNHPRFARANDVVRYARIVGRIRFGLYDNTNTPSPLPVSEVAISWGLCFLKGDYAADGTWTPTDEIPTPAWPEDENEKWLHKDHLFLGWGLITSNNNGTQQVRQSRLSNDDLLPYGSLVDIQTKRRKEYAERLHLIAKIYTSGVVDQYSVFVNWNLRVLVKRGIV